VVFHTRRAGPLDARAMADAHLDSIRVRGPAFYSPDAVETWASAVAPDTYLRATVQWVRGNRSWRSGADNRKDDALRLHAKTLHAGFAVKENRACAIMS
jgi:hypothetical protein